MRGLNYWLNIWRALNPARRKWMPLRVWWWLKPPIRVYAKTAASLDQSGFQFYNNDGTEATATTVAAEDTNATLEVDTVYHLRIQVDDTASGGENNVMFKLQRNLNTAGWVDVTSTSTVVQSAASQLTESGNTTARLTAPSGSPSFITPNGGQDESNGAIGEGNLIDFVDTTHDYVEGVWAFQILSGDVANNDTIQFRVIRTSGTVLESYTLTPQATVNEGAAGQTLTGTVFAPTLSFPAGSVDLTVTGTAAFAPTLTFPTGSIAALIGGTAAFTPALSFPTGSVDLTVLGSVFTPTLSFPAGSVDLTVTGTAAFTPALSFPTGQFAGAWTAAVTEFTFHDPVAGNVLTPTLSFPTGSVDLAVLGGVFAPALSFPAGSIAALIGGTTAFTPALSFPTGSVDLTVLGAVFAPTLSFPTGTASLGGGAQTLTGTVFTPTLSFPTGSVDLTVLGAVFAPVLSFPTGAVNLAAGPQTLTGNVFTPGLVFPAGSVDLTLLGSVFTPVLSFPAGTVLQEQTLTGTVFTPALVFPAGTVLNVNTLTGTTFTPALSFPAGALDLTVLGAVFAPTLTFPAGVVLQEQTVTGSVFAPVLVFPTGTVSTPALSFWTRDPVGATSDPAGFTRTPVGFTRIGPDDPPPW